MRGLSIRRSALLCRQRKFSTLLAIILSFWGQFTSLLYESRFLTQVLNPFPFSCLQSGDSAEEIGWVSISERVGVADRWGKISNLTCGDNENKFSAPLPLLNLLGEGNIFPMPALIWFTLLSTGMGHDKAGERFSPVFSRFSPKNLVIKSEKSKLVFFLFRTHPPRKCRLRLGFQVLP